MWKESAEIIEGAIDTLKVHPKLLVPLLTTWSLMAPVTLYLSFGMDWKEHTLGTALLIGFCAHFFLALCLAVSSSVLAEMIEQIETGRPVSLVAASIDAFALNMWAVLPLALIWSVLWFAVTVLTSMLKKQDKAENEQALTLENAAKALAGEEEASVINFLSWAFLKQLRMINFLVIPVIAWDDVGLFKAVKKGLSVCRTHLGAFQAGFLAMEGLAFIIFLPVGIVCWLSSPKHGPALEFPSAVWLAVIAYTAMAWSFVVYIEQMFCAGLYLWHKKWEREVIWAKAKGQKLPALIEVKMPTLVDGVPHLLKQSVPSEEELRKYSSKRGDAAVRAGSPRAAFAMKGLAVFATCPHCGVKSNVSKEIGEPEYDVKPDEPGIQVCCRSCAKTFTIPAPSDLLIA